MNNQPSENKADWYSNWSMSDLLDGIKRSERELLDIYAPRIRGRGIYSQDFYLLGIARRMLAQSAGFRRSVEDRNSLVAVSLVRMQLDTILRLYALYWVADPEEFARAVFAGKQVDRLKAADGELMKDKYLRDKLAERNPWVHSVYSETSGYIHFSQRHIFAALESNDEKPGEFAFAIGPGDRDKPDSYYQEIMAAFLHINMMIRIAAEDWLDMLVAAAASAKVDGRPEGRPTD